MKKLSFFHTSSFLFACEKDTIQKNEKTILNKSNNEHWAILGTEMQTNRNNKYNGEIIV